MRRTLWSGAFVCVLAYQALGAQQVSQQMSVGQNQSIMASIMSPVTGAAYQAEEVTVSVQKLVDGTTITHEWRGTIARDADGRMRQDLYIVRLAQMNGHPLDKTLQSVTVGDPVSHTMLIWSDSKLKVAMRMQLPVIPGVNSVFMVPPPPKPGYISTVKPASNSPADEVKTEDLGQESIEGVLATGKRVTTTIPTGKIGNDRPIVTVHEEWRSPELKILVKSLDSDPRTGVQTMEVHNLVRAVPDPTLFEAPEGYKVQDMADMFKGLGNIGRVPSTLQAPK